MREMACWIFAQFRTGNAMRTMCSPQVRQLRPASVRILGRLTAINHCAEEGQPEGETVKMAPGVNS